MPDNDKAEVLAEIREAVREEISAQKLDTLAQWCGELQQKVEALGEELKKHRREPHGDSGGARA